MAPTSTHTSARGISPGWSHEEINAIHALRAQGMNWDEVSARLPGRTAGACKRRYHYEKKMPSDPNGPPNKFPGTAHAKRKREAAARQLASIVEQVEPQENYRPQNHGFRSIQPLQPARAEVYVMQNNNFHDANAMEVDEEEQGSDFEPEELKVLNAFTPDLQDQIVDYVEKGKSMREILRIAPTHSEQSINDLLMCLYIHGEIGRDHVA